MRIALIIMFLWAALLARGQSNWAALELRTDTAGTILLADTLRIFAPSLELYSGGQRLADSLWRLDGQRLYLGQANTQMQLRFRQWPRDLSEFRAHKNLDQIGKIDSNQSQHILGKNYAYNPYKTLPSTSQDIDMQGLKYSGTFGRALSVGSNQSLVQDANFNLQLSGKLGDVEVIASITDNNVPFQPNGNTQQLQDFDRVFIEFKLGGHSLIAGDYNLTQLDAGYFARYNRRLQGGRLRNSFKAGKGRLNTSFSAALARGKYARNLIQGQEGNQGPYKLTGNNGERYIIVIAGTEQVFIDGQALTRGADKDYTIDYNLGEVRFTNKQLITKDKRIVVEFTYNDLNYLRSLYDIQAEWKSQKATFRFSHFSEQDAKNQSTQQVLNDTSRLILSQVGDSLNYAYTSGLTPLDSIGSALIRYKLIDTIVGGLLFDSVVVYAPYDTANLYTVQFSAVASGGDYIRLQNGSNGAVYQWVAPDLATGLSQGTHAPVQFLVAPKKQQLTALGLRLPTNKNGYLDAEVALSNNDINTFSKIGNADNHGLAAKISAQQLWPAKDSQALNITLQTHYEYVQARFLPLDFYRAREFQRDWNTTGLASSDEHWARASLRLQNRQLKNLQYEASALLKDSIYRGLRQDLRFDFSPLRGLQMLGGGNMLFSQSDSTNGRFLRPQADIIYTLPKLDFQFGARYEQEYNRLRLLQSDSLARQSFAFEVFKVYMNLPQGSRAWQASAYVQRRRDHAPAANKFIVATIADEASLSAKWQQNTQQSLDFNLSYRSLDVVDTDTSRTRQVAKNTYLGRSEYNLNLKKGFLRANTIYELSAGQQQKIEYNYIQTDAGTGTHVWIDRNADGTQQQNEFEIANFQDQANYIRLTVLTNEFIPTQNVAFSQSLDIQPKILFARQPQKLEGRPLLKFLLRFSGRSLLRIDRKSFALSAVQPFNPFLLKVADTSLVSLSSLVQNALYLNRSMPNFNLEINQSDTRSKNLLSTGFESRQKQEYGSILRFKLNKQLIISQQNSVGRKANLSEFFPDRDYNIDFFATEAQLTYLMASYFRLQGKYAYRQQNNRIGQLEYNKSHTLSVEGSYNKTRAWNLRASLSFTQLVYEGPTNTPVEFAMNEGLRAGSNLLWSCGLDKAIAPNVQFSLQYEGRKTADSPVIHVGRAQVRANF